VINVKTLQAEDWKACNKMRRVKNLGAGNEEENTNIFGQKPK
jgi:hypothetical protein